MHIGGHYRVAIINIQYAITWKGNSPRHVDQGLDNEKNSKEM